ncbi:MAG: hypothetical protein QNL62_07175 [Gammaproteobacteria bacterium]|nr:hypothetical protein [Gammaproteobacteria bacterium]
MARKLPFIPGKYRALLQRVHGVRFEDWKTTFLGEDVFFDDIYLENIRVGRNVRITAGVHILTHYFTPSFSQQQNARFVSIRVKLILVIMYLSVLTLLLPIR